jgi:gamma-glutamylcyclotransferase (GGCT)/AIG2-like uncharacterized protein YtfP
MSITNPTAENVFTYGTLMFPAVWKAVTGRDEQGEPARLAGHVVFRVRDAVFPGMVWTGGASTVRGVLYRNVVPVALERLDEFEESFYERRTVSVIGADGTACTCSAYVVPAHREQVLTREPWTAEQFAARGDLARFLGRYQGFSRLNDQRRQFAEDR